MTHPDFISPNTLRAGHPCPLPTPSKSDVGHLYLCDCGRLYVAREVWAGDCMSGDTVPSWKPIRARKWWKR